MKNIKNYFPYFLLGIYIILFTFLAISPLDRATWWAENIPVMIVVVILVLAFKKFRFSNTSYFLMTLFLCFHTIGGHYTFEKVPFDTFNAMLNSLNMDFIFSEGRNNFDRVGHFLIGVFAYPVAELVVRKKWVTNIWMAIFVGIFALGFWGALYEIIEMIYAILFGGEQAANFLGSQGDIWDAQKDMLLDISGAVLISVLFYFNYKNSGKKGLK
ncbi:hypothetical protein CSA08_03540 [Candidatus Gracilibacteria bacterium]|nr:MAG: hypothetical protein CSA08_03540 [Candidatus Gracilibacteria bacterium]